MDDALRGLVWRELQCKCDGNDAESGVSDCFGTKRLVNVWKWGEERCNRETQEGLRRDEERVLKTRGME